MKAYIVEDNESMRIILKYLLKRNFPSISTVAESETAEEALVEIPAFEPDVTLVDISLPGMNGIEMIRQLKSRCQNMHFLVVTGHEIDSYRKSALQAGAEDIVSKHDDEVMLEKIRKLLETCENEKG